ncbi:hypothetical protein [Streptomyces sp. T028]|uniref:hypothetical protein n=1 Tax=Streptomyces sp. T028 TaxID=3394379 RepID=UPI003A8AA262
MSGTDRQTNRRIPILMAAGLLVAAVGLGILGVVRDNNSRLEAVEDAGRAFLKALAAGEGKDVCGRMTRIAQSQLAAEQHKGSCPQAVAALVGPLDDTERNELASSCKSRFFEREGSFGHVGVRDNPLGITELLLSESDGNWLVAEMK